MNKKNVATIYNPNLLSKEELVSNFVVRQRKFKKIFKDIKASKMIRPEQHLLIEGQRGMGKTTILLRLSYELENDPELNKWLIPVVFNEEQYDVNSLSGLWELLAKYLEDKDESFHGLFDEMDSNYSRFEENEREYEKFIFLLLIRALKREGKKLLLFIDNFGEMFTKLENESQRLREILMTCEYLRIIAASSIVSEAFFKYDEPLYEFFKIEKLNELTFEETKALLLKLGGTYGENRVKEIIEKEPERIETLRRLTGGVTRTIVLLYEIFIDDETGNAFNDLESVLDRVTPLYKHRMDDLSPQLQKIVHTIALNWDAMPTREIAKKTRIPSGSVAAQLKKLAKSGLILEIKPEHTKNKLYIIRERFFNIWYLMRNGRKGDKNRVIWLARFFENWLNPKDLRTRVEKFLDGFEKGIYGEKQKNYLVLLYKHPILRTPRYLLQEILLKESQNTNKEIKLSAINDNKEVFKYKLENPNFSFSQTEFKELLFLSNISLIVKGKIIEDFRKISKETFRKITSSLKKERSYLREKAITLIDEKDDCEGNFITLAKLHLNYLNNIEQGLYYYTKAANIGCYDNLQLGKLFTKYKDSFNAEKYFLRAVQDDGNEKALIELGNLYKDIFNDYKEARDFYKEAYSKTGNRSAIFRYAWILDKLGKFEESVEAYLEFVKLPGYKGGAYANIAWICKNEFNDYETTEYYLLKAIEEKNSNAKRWLGELYIQDMGKFEEGESILLDRIREEDHESMNSLAWVYYLISSKPKEALIFSSRAFGIKQSSFIAHTHATVLLWNEKFKEADKVVQRFFSDYENIERFENDIIDYLLLLISKGRYSNCYEIFSSQIGKKNKLKDRFKPVYYSLMHFMKKEHPLEHLKMGEELKETVQEILDKIEEKKKKYRLNISK